MPLKTYREAINQALLQEMKKDENVVVIGAVSYTHLTLPTKA